jgi:hypothetical protein
MVSAGTFDDYATRRYAAVALQLGHMLVYVLPNRGRYEQILEIDLDGNLHRFDPSVPNLRL